MSGARRPEPAADLDDHIGAAEPVERLDDRNVRVPGGELVAARKKRALDFGVADRTSKALENGLHRLGDARLRPRWATIRVAAASRTIRRLHLGNHLLDRVDGDIEFLPFALQLVEDHAIGFTGAGLSLHWRRLFLMVEGTTRLAFHYEIDPVGAVAICIVSQRYRQLLRRECLNVSHL